MINLKKRHIIYLIIFSIFLATTTSTLAAFIMALKKNDSIANTKIVSNKPKDYKYLIKEVDGKINIFQNSNTSPAMVLKKPAIFLPEFDRKMLSEGIYVSTSDELNSIIEDYED